MAKGAPSKTSPYPLGNAGGKGLGFGDTPPDNPNPGDATAFSPIVLSNSSNYARDIEKLVCIIKINVTTNHFFKLQ